MLAHLFECHVATGVISHFVFSSRFPPVSALSSFVLCYNMFTRLIISSMLAQLHDSAQLYSRHYHTCNFDGGEKALVFVLTCFISSSTWLGTAATHCSLARPPSRSWHRPYLHQHLSRRRPETRRSGRRKSITCQSPDPSSSEAVKVPWREI